MTLAAPRQHSFGAQFDGDLASEIGFLPFSLVRILTGTSIASSEAFGSSAIAKQNILTGVAIPSSEAFGSSLRVFPKGAQGTKPTTNDTRTTVTGPEDLSGKKFTNAVLLTGSGVTGTRVVFAKKPTFQDCDASLTDVWFDQNTNNGLCDVIGATTTTNVTIRRYTANQYTGNAISVDGTHVGNVKFYNGFQRPLPADPGLDRVLTGVAIPSSEAFGSSAVHLAKTVTGVSIPSSEAFGVGEIDIAGALGSVVVFAVTDIGDQIYGTWAPGVPSTDPRDGPEDWPGAQLWRAQRWVDLYLDKAQFGRNDKTTPPVTVGQITIGTSGVPIDNATGLAISSGYTVATVGLVVTCTLNLQCSSIKVNGDPLHPDRLVITGKVWVVDPNADDSPNLTAFNQTWDSTVGGSALLEFHDCTPALSNVYIFGANADPAFRFDDCARLTSNTPFIDGGYFKAASHDVAKYGGLTDLYLRHCTWKPHSFVAAYTDPVVVGGLPLYNRVKNQLVAAGGNLPAWEAGRTYSQYDAVFTRAKEWNPVSAYAVNDKVAYGSWNWKAKRALAAGTTPPAVDVSDANWSLDQANYDRYYSVGSANQSGHALPAPGLGGHNAQWQFYGNLHADLDQGFQMLNPTVTPAFENCFWYQGQHVSIYLEKAQKVFFQKLTSTKDTPPVAWSAASNYQGSNPVGSGVLSDVVRGSDGEEYVAIAYSGPANGGARDPANNANPAYWVYGSAHNIKGRYCLSHGNNTGFSNANLNPSNGFLDCVFSRDFATNPVQANANNDTADGVHVTNKRNRYANAGASNPFIAGSTTS